MKMYMFFLLIDTFFFLIDNFYLIFLLIFLLIFYCRDWLEGLPPVLCPTYGLNAQRELVGCYVREERYGRGARYSRSTATFRWQRDTAACLATLPDHASNGQVGNKLEHRRSVSSWGRDRRHRLLLGLDSVKLYLEIQVGCIAGSTDREAEIFGIDWVSIFLLYSRIGSITTQGPGYIRGGIDVGCMYVPMYLCTSPTRLSRHDTYHS